ncbi:hypothetical protein B566_EDAN007086 [Ephemera danica]|nr:hypothetical protein B566_EDAN007086 [Ephemera danica]
MALIPMLQRLDIRGRVKALHGQNRRTEEPPLALFAVCTPFGPPSLLEVPQKLGSGVQEQAQAGSRTRLHGPEVGIISNLRFYLILYEKSDVSQGKLLLGYSDAELANMGGYHLVHFDDLAYVASAHQELLKTGASGMIAYRYQTKDGSWQWLQTSSRLVYKNSKPDFVISTHRPLMEEEGRDLLGKRTMDFKVSYLDAGLSNSYFTDSDMPAGGAASSQSSPCTSPPAQSTPHGAPRVNRRYKTQLRDFLSTCRTKRKLQAQPAAQQQPTVAQPTTQQTEYVAELQATASPPAPPTSTPLQGWDVNCLASTSVFTIVISPSGSSSSSSAAVAAAAAAATAAAAAAYSGMYYSTGTGDWHQASQAAPNFHQQLYPSDNRFLADNLFHQYRALPPYYPDYHHAAVAAVAAPAAAYNGYLDVSSPPPRYEVPSKSPSGGEDRLYSCQLDRTSNYLVYEVPSKSPSGGEDRLYSCQLDRTSNYLVFPHQHEQLNGLQQDKKPKLLQGLHGHSPPAAGSPEHNGLVKLEHEKDLQGYHPANDTRQTVLMWGSGSVAPPVTTAGSRPSSAASLHGYLHEQDPKCKSPGYMQQQQGDPLKSLAEMNSSGENKSWYQQQQQQHGGKPRLGSPPGQYQEVWGASTYHGASSYPGHYYSAMHHHHHHYARQQQQQLGGPQQQQLPPNPPPSSGEISAGCTSNGGGGLKQQQQQERSPLLSISEVTNTLLEHGGD